MGNYKKEEKKESPPQLDMKEWHNHLKKVLNHTNLANNTENINDLNEEPIITVDNLNKNITMEELSRALNKLKTKKASGEDGIIPEFLKEAPDVIGNYLLNLFNYL